MSSELPSTDPAAPAPASTAPASTGPAATTPASADPASTARHRSLARPQWSAPASFWYTVLGPGLAGIAALTIIVVGFVMGLDINATGAMLGILFIGLVVAWIVYTAYWGRVRRTTLDRVRDLTEFAEGNGLHYVSEQRAPDILTAVLDNRPGAFVYDSLSARFPREISLGTYERTTKRNRGGFMEDWGYLAIRLNRKLPNILLESRSSRSTSSDTSLLGPPRGNQRLELEGDFDNHFRLYCPAGYEQDALYVFTPDLMALMIDEAGDLSAQLIDDVALFFSAKPFDLSDDQLRDRLLRIADVVGSKALRQTARYRDDRSNDVDAVGDEGKRLTRRRPRWPTLALWYSVKVLLGMGLAWVLLVIRLGFDPLLWKAISYTPWW